MMKENRINMNHVFCAHRVRTLLIAFAMLMVSVLVSAEGFIPTDAGLIVDLKPGDKILLSVMYNGKEYFVSDYEGYTSSSPFVYTAVRTLKLIPQSAGATEPSAASVWTIDKPLTRKSLTMDGIIYTMNSKDGYTLLADNGFKIKGSLTNNKGHDGACDVAFVVPTVRSRTNMDPKGTLTASHRAEGRTMGDNAKPGQHDWAFDGKTGVGFGGRIYREVYMFASPKENNPRTYTNSALVGFNLTNDTLKYKDVDIAVGQADWMFNHITLAKDTPYVRIPRTLFRLYILEDGPTAPFTSCPNSYFFAYDRQNYRQYKNIDGTGKGDGTLGDYTPYLKTYTTDYLFRMDSLTGNVTGHGKIWKTDYMTVPADDSTYYYVGERNNFHAAGGLGSNNAKSAFAKIRQLPLQDRAGGYAPAGACGRMVVDTTSSADNLGVAFEPAGYFFRASSGRNVEMIQENDSTWRTEEAWTITGDFMELSGIVLMYSGSDFSLTDTGIVVPGWSKWQKAVDIPVAGGEPGETASGKTGWAKIHTNRTDSNGHIEFVVAEQSKFVRYHNNGHFGQNIPDQYLGKSGDNLVVTPQDARLLQGYLFEGWAATPNGAVVIHPKDSSSYPLRVGVELTTDQLTEAGLTFTNNTVLHLYAKARYQGSIHVAVSFMHDGKRYFLTQPGVAPRYATARTFDDWTNVYQGMANINNNVPNYLSSYKIIGRETVCAECEPGEYVLDPKHETMMGSKDSLTFYEHYMPSEEEYIGLYYPYPGIGYTNDGPYYVLSNNTWAGLFRSSNGWPTPARPCVEHTTLSSSHYLTRIESAITRVPREASLGGDILLDSIISYNLDDNLFEGVATPGLKDTTDFMLSGVGVVDAHYVILPDTTDDETPWTESITFGYHEDQRTAQEVWSKLIGKQLMAQMKVGNDTIYFHPNQNNILTNANALRLGNGFRLTHAFEYIRDARVVAQHVVAEADTVAFEETDNAFKCLITSGERSPRDVQYGGRYIDMVDTLRVWLQPNVGSKIKRYYGRWGDKARGVHMQADGSRYRDILVTTKTYHYGPNRTSVRLVPENDSYRFGSLTGSSANVNFRLQLITYRELVDIAGTPLCTDTISIKDTTSVLDLRSATFTLRMGDGVFAMGAPTKSGIRLTTKLENTSPNENRDTLTVAMADITIDDQTYSVDPVRVPLQQVSTQGTELVWSVMHPSNGKRYFIMVDKDGKSKIQDLSIDNTTNRLVRNKNELFYGSYNEDGGKEERQHITPWMWRDVSANQLKLITEHKINRAIKFAAATAGTTATFVSDTATASALTYIMDTIYTNANGNYEEIVRIKYELKWLKYDGTNLILTSDSTQASQFSWAYMLPEYHLLSNGTYPDHNEAVFGYNSASSVRINAAYQVEKEYSMLLNNQLLHLCKTNEATFANLTSPDKEWLTSYQVDTIRDRRTFDAGASTTSSGLNAPTRSNFQTTVTPSSATSPTNVKIGGKYVDIVDTLRITVGLQDKPSLPVYLFDKWEGVSSFAEASLKIPLVRKTYHTQTFDTVACVVDGDEYNFAFPSALRAGVRADSVHTFTLRTMRRRGTIVLDVDNNVVSSTSASVDSTRAMNLNNVALAEVRLMDDYGKRPDWCVIESLGKNIVRVKCLSDGVRSPRVAYLYFAYIVMVDPDNNPATSNTVMQFVNYRLSVSQASKFQYANNQHLDHSRGASGDEELANGMQRVHENRRILYYYNPRPYDEPDQNVELPVRERSFYGWWRWYREGKDELGNDVGDCDVPDSLWQTPPRNVGKFNFPFRIIGDSVDAGGGKKKLVTQGRYSVFHYPARQYNDLNAGFNARQDPPAKSPLVYPPINKDTLTYVLDLSNYYDNLPLSMATINQVDTAMLDTMRRIVEPTLSLREIFELHPWTEMAEKLEGYKDTIDSDYRNQRYMEDHVVRAPIGNALLLSTEQRYIYDSIAAGGHSESLLGYYMRDDNWSSWDGDTERQDTMIWCGGWPDDDVTMGWYTYNPETGIYTECEYPTAGDDFLKVPAVTSISGEFDTVYYCLRAQSKASTFDGSNKVTTTEGGYWFNICRYKVIYHNKNLYGPVQETTKNGVTKALITNDEIEQTYSVLARLNFDYNKTGTDYQVYPHPLPWADASYGYSYPVSPGLPDNRYHNDFAPNFPGPGEYSLINKIPYSKHWYTMEQHGGSENGYMIYCDGMSSAGQVAALSLDTTLCAGQKMYLSAYIGNPSRTNKAKPNFLFSVQGSTNGTDWDDITSYMTGELNASQLWYQIFFPIENDRSEGTEYQKFRVRIYNMAANWDGNDFTIDDICIFANRPPLVAYQANTTCIGKNETDSITHVVLRVDYQGITEEGRGYNGNDVFYTVERVPKAGGAITYVHMIDGFINEETSGDTIYGVVHVPLRDHVTADGDSVFSSVEELVDRFDQTLDKYQKKEIDSVYRVGYVYETVEDKSVRPVMYIVHKAKMTPDNHYTVRMSLKKTDLMSAICAMTSRLKISNRMMLELNGEVQDGKEVGGLCANTTYEIGMRVKGSLYRDSIAPIELDGSCMNDWLLYGDSSKASSESRYGYKYSDIEQVITKILRADLPTTTNANQKARNLGEISRNEMLRVQSIIEDDLDLSEGVDPYTLISDLVNNGFLSLYEGKKTATVTQDDSVCYMVFPIIGTGSDQMQSMEVEVCPTPLYIKLKSRDNVAPVPMMIGGLLRDATESGVPVAILTNAQTANTEIAIRIDSIVPLKGIHAVELQSTNDPAYIEAIHTLNLQPNLIWPSSNYYVKGDTMRLSPATGNNFEMHPGYDYTFNIVMSTHGGSLTEESGTNAGCPVGAIPFTVCVVPDYLRWEPKTTTANRWNNPDNWLGVTAQNRPIHADAHYVPLATTKVIIPALPDTLPYPVMSNTFNISDRVNKVGYQYNTCADIRFLPGSAIGGQQYLNYDNVIIDMTIPQQKWALRSAPVKDMVSGDLYMSKADINDVSTPWEVGQFDADGRNYQSGTASFWLSLYDHVTYRKGTYGDSTAIAGEASWSKVTNGMTLPLDTAHGWAVYGRTKSGSAPDVRLPKHDTRYYYFDGVGGRMDDMYEIVNRGANAGKLAYHKGSGSYTLTNAVADSSFVFGNPTMAYIDIWGFIADNKTANGLKEEFSYLDGSGVYTTVTKGVTDFETDTIANPKRYLPPMHAMVIKGTPATSHVFTLNANRIVTKASQRVPVASAPARGRSMRSKGIMTVTAVNPVSDRCLSRLLIGQGYNDAIQSGEDAVLTTLNIDKFSMTNTPTTPFNIYAVENGYGLSIDLRDSVVNVPLSFYMSDLPFDPVTRLWFTGVNSITGPLVLYDDFTGIERTIIDGICINIETPQANHERRYYIRRPGYVPEQIFDPITTGGQQPAVNTQDQQAQKILHNGHVYVLRNGNVYSIFGQKLR